VLLALREEPLERLWLAPALRLSVSTFFLPIRKFDLDLLSTFFNHVLDDPT
jgi:hypothetical protein